MPQRRILEPFCPLTLCRLLAIQKLLKAKKRRPASSGSFPYVITVRLSALKSDYGWIPRPVSSTDHPCGDHFAASLVRLLAHSRISTRNNVPREDRGGFLSASGARKASFDYNVHLSGRGIEPPACCLIRRSARRRACCCARRVGRRVQ